VWVDANHDGKTDAGELKTLGQLGITELDLTATKGSATDNGNVLGLTSSYKTTDGKTHDMADVWFAKDASGASTTSTPTKDDLLVGPHVTHPATVQDASAATSTAQHAAHHAALLHHRRPEDDDAQPLPPLL